PAALSPLTPTPATPTAAVELAGRESYRMCAPPNKVHVISCQRGARDIRCRYIVNVSTDDSMSTERSDRTMSLQRGTGLTRCRHQVGEPRISISACSTSSAVSETC